MEVPTYDQLIHPLLVILGRHDEPVKARQARTELADHMQLSPEVRAAMLPSGAQSVFDNRTGWAHDRLKRASLSRSARRGFWQLTEDGRSMLARFPDAFPEEVLAEISRVGSASKVPDAVRHAAATVRTEQRTTKSNTTAVPDEVLTKSPRERLEAAHGDLIDQLVDELLEQVRATDPSFFEKLVLDLLHAMGYGVSRQALSQVGQSGDGGIDGIVNLDQLGLQKVYVQAKRWNGGNTVGRPEIQAFYGALAERRATYGVFITTSALSKPAMAAATTLSDTLVLIDGQRLVRLMIDHNVGVSAVSTFSVKRLDSDYFADE